MHEFGNAARAGNLVEKQPICVLRAGERMPAVEREELLSPRQDGDAGQLIYSQDGGFCPIVFGE